MHIHHNGKCQTFTRGGAFNTLQLAYSLHSLSGETEKTRKETRDELKKQQQQKQNPHVTFGAK